MVDRLGDLLTAIAANPDQDLFPAMNLLRHTPPVAVEATQLLRLLQQLLGLSSGQSSAQSSALAFGHACIDYYQAAISTHPNLAQLHYALGTIHAELQQHDTARACYTTALQLQPTYAEAYFSLGNLDLKAGKLTAASALYQQAIAFKPEFAKPYINQAYILEKQGELEAAIALLQTAIVIQPDIVEAHTNLGNLLLIQAKIPEAIASFEAAISLNPDYVPARRKLATARYRLAVELKQQKPDQAIAELQQALTLQPQLTEAALLLANMLAEQGKAALAINYYEMVLQSQPEHAYAYRQSCLTLPILYNFTEEISVWRQRFTQRLQELEQKVRQMSSHLTTNQRWLLPSLLAETNFYLVYQGQNDTALQAQYGQLVHEVMAASYPQWSQHLAMPPLDLNSKPGKIRIGYVSTNLRFHAATRSTMGWLQHCDRQSFEVYGYYAAARTDFMTTEFKRQSDYLYQIPDNLEAICAQIYADRLHILVFPDIGMHGLTTAIAALRLAPLQCVCWGHPVTTGLPTMDYYLSSDVMEPANAQAHYTETLVRLPKLGVSYPKPAMPAFRHDRADFQLPEGSVIYLSSQSLFKYLPQHDYLFAAIAARVPGSKFVFFAHPSPAVTEQFRDRLQLAFAKVSLDMTDFVIISPRLDWNRYLNLNLVADIFLDTVGFSGGNTTLDAIACHLPVVTLPGEFMRSRLAVAMLEVLGDRETIAQSEADYIDIAVKLALEPVWRHKIVGSMQLHHNQLYDDQSCIAALEQFFRDVVAAKLKNQC